MDKVIHKLPAASLWLVFALMPFIAIAGGLALAPAGAIIGLVGWLVLLRLNATKFILKSPWFWTLCVLLMWCFAAQYWSLYTSKASSGRAVTLILAIVILSGAVTTFKALSQQSRQFLRHVFMAGGVFAAALMCIEILSGFGLSILVDPVNPDEIIHTRQSDAEQNLGRGILIYVQLLPALIALLAVQFKRGWVLALGVVLLLILTAYFNRLSLTSYVMIASLIAMAITLRFPKFGVLAACLISVLFIITGPLTGLFASQFTDAQLLQLPLSVEHRFRMWAYVWERINENIWLGNGFDASRAYEDTFTARDGREISIVSLHPHNIALQIWLEIGAIGAALTAITMVLLIKPALDFAQTPLRASALAGTIISVTLFGSATIGVWQIWWLASIFVTLGVLHLIPRHKTTRPY